MIASDIERDRMDLLLSFPVSRARLLTEKFAALLVPIVALNAVVGLVIYLGTVVVGSPIDVVTLAVVHLLSIPYLLTCAGIGLVLSVLVSRADIAQRAALGVIFVLYLIESIATSTDQYNALKYVSPTYYYDPTAILVRNDYAVAETAVLVVVTLALLVVAQYRFRQRDI